MATSDDTDQTAPDDNLTRMTRDDLIEHARALTTALGIAQAAHAATRERLQASETARERAETGRDFVLNESRATKGDLDQARIDAWQAGKQRQLAEYVAAGAVLVAAIAIGALVHATLSD
jgi:hypothetical protein